MIDQRILPGQIRDAIVDYLKNRLAEASVAEMKEAVGRRLGSSVPSSSVWSYLRLNTETLFDRTGIGTYRLKSTVLDPFAGAGSTMAVAEAASELNWIRIM